MGNLRTSTSNLAQEQAIIFREIERLRIAEGFHDRVAPEFLVALFELNQIQMDLESKSLLESGDIQKVSDRISAGIHELLAVLNPPNEEVQQPPNALAVPAEHS